MEEFPSFKQIRLS